MGKYMTHSSNGRAKSFPLLKSAQDVKLAADEEDSILHFLSLAELVSFAILSKTSLAKFKKGGFDELLINHFSSPNFQWSEAEYAYLLSNPTLIERIRVNKSLYEAVSRKLNFPQRNTLFNVVNHHLLPDYLASLPLPLARKRLQYFSTAAYQNPAFSKAVASFLIDLYEKKGGRF